MIIKAHEKNSVYPQEGAEGVQGLLIFVHLEIKVQYGVHEVKTTAWCHSLFLPSHSLLMSLCA